MDWLASVLVFVTGVFIGSALADRSTRKELEGMSGESR